MGGVHYLVPGDYAKAIVIRERYLYGKTFKEIAKGMHISKQNAEQLEKWAFKRLKKRLREYN